MNTQPLGPFAGLNNRLPDYALGATKAHGAYLSAAENVDLDNSGHLRLRRAGALVQALSAPHSLSPDGAYLVRGGILYTITLPTYSETLVKVLSNDSPVSWVELNGDLYYSNGVDCGRIHSGVHSPMAFTTPDAPTTSEVAGSLFAGAYQVAVSYARYVDGVLVEEGGVSASSNPQVTLGGLRVTLPAPTPYATHANVYVSTVNGSVPLLQAAVLLSLGHVDITMHTLGRESNQRYEDPLPAGKLFLFNGCLCSFDGSNVYEGSPFRPGYYLPAEGRIPFPDTVSNVVPAQNGVYVVADKTYWLSGPRMTTTEMIQDVLPYGGVPGTAFVVPQKSLYGWFGDKGFVLGGPQGEVQAVMTETVDVTLPVSGVSAVFEDRGYRRVVSCGYCLNLENLGITTYADYTYTSIAGQYGTKADGIYDLTASGNVSYTIGLGKQDFGAENLKHMPVVYLGCSSVDPMQVRIQTPSHDYTYTARSSAEELKMQRVDTGRGLRSNWFDLSIIGESDFTLASVSFGPVASQRRI